MTNTEESIHARIKWLLIALSVLVAVGAFLVLVWEPYRRQIQLIEEIEAVGGWVSTGKVSPDWLRELVGRERMKGFGAIYRVSLKDTPIDDAWLKRLGRLPSVETLEFDRTQISDDGPARSRGNWSPAHGGRVGRGGGTEHGNLSAALPLVRLQRA